MQEVTGSTPVFSTSFKSPKGDFLRFANMGFVVYIIYSFKLDKYYVGYTEDMEVRLAQHNSGISDYTAKADDWEVKYTEAFETRAEAMKREKEVKNKKSRKYIEWLISSFG